MGFVKMNEEAKESWSWCVGVLAGFGDCAFQRSGPSIRRLTKIGITPDGGVVLIPWLPLLGKMTEEVGHINANSTVVLFSATDQLIGRLDEIWIRAQNGKGGILPASAIDISRLKKQ